jgi:hypothetical protein
MNRLTNDQLMNLIDCAQKRFKDCAMSGDYDRHFREGRTVTLWTQQLANLWDVYAFIED